MEFFRSLGLVMHGRFWGSSIARIASGYGGGLELCSTNRLASSRCIAIESYCLFEHWLRGSLQTQKRLEARRRPTGAAQALPCECF